VIITLYTPREWIEKQEAKKAAAEAAAAAGIEPKWVASLVNGWHCPQQQGCSCLCDLSARVNMWGWLPLTWLL
jgi:hypothetical protein